MEDETGGNQGGNPGGVPRGNTAAVYIKETSIDLLFGDTADSEQVSTFGVTGSLGQTSIYGAGNTGITYSDN